MTQTHLRWIRMPLPVGADWQKQLVQDVYPFLEAADATGVINQWYFNCIYQRGPIMDIYIQADSKAVHSVLRPTLRKRFGNVVTLEHPNKLLNGIRPQFSIKPANMEVEILTDLNVVSTQIVASNTLGKAGLSECYAEVLAALESLDRDPDWISAFAKTQLGDWLDTYFQSRIPAHDFADRQNQEAQLLSFLSNQKPIPERAFIHPQKTAWTEGFQALDGEFSAKRLLAKALNEHINRYGLSPFQVGQLWLSASMVPHEVGGQVSLN